MESTNGLNRPADILSKQKPFLADPLNLPCKAGQGNFPFIAEIS